MLPKLLIKIRVYKKSDQAVILELLRLNTPKYFAEDEEQSFINYLNHEIDQYFIIEFKNTIVGCGGINLINNKTTARISWDIIHPDYHGKGIGSLLLMHRIELIKQMQIIPEIRVRTSQLVYHFYQKNGFELQNIQKDYWAKGFDLFDMKYNN